MLAGISLYPQGTLPTSSVVLTISRYIPVPTGNARTRWGDIQHSAVYPCTYRELMILLMSWFLHLGISLYLQGTQLANRTQYLKARYIPVPTGNSWTLDEVLYAPPVYPCTYRELGRLYFLITNNPRYIPVPTGNSSTRLASLITSSVYPCTYRELYLPVEQFRLQVGISLYLQGTRRLASSLSSIARYIPVPTGNSSDE